MKDAVRSIGTSTENNHAVVTCTAFGWVVRHLADHHEAGRCKRDDHPNCRDHWDGAHVHPACSICVAVAAAAKDVDFRAGGWPGQRVRLLPLWEVDLLGLRAVDRAAAVFGVAATCGRDVCNPGAWGANYDSQGRRRVGHLLGYLHHQQQVILPEEMHRACHARDASAGSCLLNESLTETRPLLYSFYKWPSGSETPAFVWEFVFYKSSKIFLRIVLNSDSGSTRIFRKRRLLLYARN